MKYNNVGFNATWASSVTEDAFVAHEAHHGLTEAQLREAYQLMTGFVQPATPDAAKVLPSITTDGNDKGKAEASKSVRPQKGSSRSANGNKGKDSRS